jgi:hypothetical protein
VSASRASQASGAPVKKTGPSTSVGATDTSSPHDALVAIGLMATFVFLMTMIAGIGPNSGRVAVLVMVLLLAGQAVTHVNPFVTWAANHPLTPAGSTTAAFTVSGMN